LDPAILLIIDAVALMGATIILGFYFIKDVLKKRREDQ